MWWVGYAIWGCWDLHGWLECTGRKERAETYAGWSPSSSGIPWHNHLFQILWVHSSQLVVALTMTMCMHLWKHHWIHLLFSSLQRQKREKNHTHHQKPHPKWVNTPHHPTQHATHYPYHHHPSISSLSYSSTHACLLSLMSIYVCIHHHWAGHCV